MVELFMVLCSFAEAGNLSTKDKFRAPNCSSYRNSTFGTSKKWTLLYPGQLTASILQIKTTRTEKLEPLTLVTQITLCIFVFLSNSEHDWLTFADSASCSCRLHPSVPISKLKNWGYGQPVNLQKKGQSLYSGQEPYPHCVCCSEASHCI